MTDEWEKVYKVHSFTPKKGSKRRPAWEGVRKKDGAKWYILKYSSKAEQKEVPASFQNVGRFWGCSASVPSKEFTELACTDMELRAYLEKEGLSVASAKVLPKNIIIPNLGH